MNPPAPIAVIVGDSGGIGGALLNHLKSDPRFGVVVGLSRGSDPPLDLTDEASIAVTAAHLTALDGELRLIINATGILKDGDDAPEKSWRALDPKSLARQFAVNAIGPALLMKYFLPLLPRHGRSVFVCLSARVSSIGDNHLGGWYGYRASKAALNQFVRTASVELSRTRPEAICIALHPGTVGTALSRPFVGDGPHVVPADQAAGRLLTVIERLTIADTGGFLDQNGETVAW